MYHGSKIIDNIYGPVFSTALICRTIMYYIAQFTFSTLFEFWSTIKYQHKGKIITI